jgi:hypothetical protein
MNARRSKHRWPPQMVKNTYLQPSLAAPASPSGNFEYQACPPNGGGSVGPMEIRTAHLS